MIWLTGGNGFFLGAKALYITNKTRPIFIKKKNWDLCKKFKGEVSRFIILKLDVWYEWVSSGIIKDSFNKFSLKKNCQRSR